MREFFEVARGRFEGGEEVYLRWWARNWMVTSDFPCPGDALPLRQRPDGQEPPGRTRCCANGHQEQRSALPARSQPRLPASIRVSPTRAHGAVVDEPRDRRLRSPSSVSTIIPCARRNTKPADLEVAADGRRLAVRPGRIKP